MKHSQSKLWFTSDYMEGAHPALLEALMQTNLMPCDGYGLDPFSEAAREKIRAACQAPQADVFFLAGGTQTNACVIDAMLTPYQGVMAAASGHVSTHEAGAIEYGGHKVLELPHLEGKLSAQAIAACIEGWLTDANREHMVMPGMAYISQPTEYGTLYSLAELKEISRTCHEAGVLLYLDGARLAYALASSANDVSLADIARLCDAFYIGGTKCGALIGEAVVFPQHKQVPHFFTLIKQHGALLAKGRLCGVQFNTLFENGLYGRIGKTAIEAADRIRAALVENGYELSFDAPTNQVFVTLDQASCSALSEHVEMGFIENLPDGRAIMRLCTSWATKAEDVDALIELLQEFASA